MAAAKAGKMNVNEIVTDRILAALEKGTVPWHMPWTVNGLLHTNLVSKKAYRGVNQMLLSLASFSGGYSSPYWVSFKQAQELGGTVKKGEKSTLVVFFKPVDKEKAKDGKAYLILRYYRVFNVEQCEGFESKIPQPDENEREFNPIEACEQIWDGFEDAPEVKYGFAGASYYLQDDTIRLPKREAFHSEDGFYATLFHEGVHSTRHASRTARDTTPTTGHDERYSKEELIAELGAAFLCGIGGIATDNRIENSAAYIASWKRNLADDPKLIVQAASKAHQAADYILGVKYDKPEDSTDTNDESEA